MIKRGPFGLWRGMSTHEFEGNMEQIGPFKFKIESPPKPHSAFEFYVLQISPGAGLSWVKAVGTTIATSGFGTELQAAFESMEAKLINAYGRNSKIDLLRTGSIWNEPREWMQALQKRERLLGATWDQETGAKLSDSLSAIYLGATAVDTEAGYIVIEYSFDNIAQAEAEIAAAEDDAL